MVQKAEENLQKKFEEKQTKSMNAFKEEMTSIKSQFRRMKKDQLSMMHVVLKMEKMAMSSENIISRMKIGL